MPAFATFTYALNVFSHVLHQCAPSNPGRRHENCETQNIPRLRCALRCGRCTFDQDCQRSDFVKTHASLSLLLLNANTSLSESLSVYVCTGVDLRQSFHGEKVRFDICTEHRAHLRWLESLALSPSQCGRTFRHRHPAWQSHVPDSGLDYCHSVVSVFTICASLCVPVRLCTSLCISERPRAVSVRLCVPVRPRASPCVPVRPRASPCVPVRPSASPCVSVRLCASPCVPVRPRASPCVPLRPLASPCVSVCLCASLSARHLCDCVPGSVCLGDSVCASLVRHAPNPQLWHGLQLSAAGALRNVPGLAKHGDCSCPVTSQLASVIELVLLATALAERGLKAPFISSVAFQLQLLLIAKSGSCLNILVGASDNNGSG